MSVYPVGDRLVGILGQDRTGSALQDRVSRLFEESRDDVYRYLLTLGLHPPRAQEAVQEVFLRLYATLRKGEQIENPRGWIFRVAHNYGLKVRGRQVVEEPFEAALEARLTEQQKRCLFLRMEGLRYPEIGSIMGISASTVGEFLRRAMTRLKKVRDE